MGFQHLSQEERYAVQVKGGQAKVPPELKAAKIKANKLKWEHEQGFSIAVIAERHGISKRSAYRIITGK